MIVADASVILELLLRTPAAADVERHLFRPAQTLHAPHLLDLEIAQVLRRYVRSHQLADARAREALSDLADLPLRRYPHTLLLPRVWELRENFTAYDAAYVALAEALGATLLTRDVKLSSAPGHRATVRLV